MLPAKQTLRRAASAATWRARELVLASASALAIAGLADARAETRNAHLSVTVQVVDQCTISTAAPLPTGAVSVMCTAGARAAVSGGTGGARPAYAVKRAEGAVTTYGPVLTSRDEATGLHRQTQLVTILF